MKSLSRVRLLATPWTTAYQAPPSMGFSRQEYWSGVPLPAIVLRLFSESSSNFTLHLALKCGTIPQCLSFLTLILSKMSFEFGPFLPHDWSWVIRSDKKPMEVTLPPSWCLTSGVTTLSGDSDFDVWWCLTGLLPCKVTYKFISIKRENCIFWGHTLRWCKYSFHSHHTFMH